MKANDEFYIGWEERAPDGIARRVRCSVVLLMSLAVMLGACLSFAQHTIGVSVFEWGAIKEFSGTLRARPYPHLLVLRPGAGDGQSSFSSYHLVKPFKFGLEKDLAELFDGKTVSLKGTLIYRGDQTMIEVADDSVRVSQDTVSSRAPESIFSPSREGGSLPRPTSLGRRTLVGEIVDSKCYLGVMNPGTLTPHRGCAIRCISGGIPPVLLVRQTRGPALYLMLVSADGKPVNKEVLDLVAEPVEVTGEVERQGELLVLRADPSTYRRIKP